MDLTTSLSTLRTQLQEERPCLIPEPSHPTVPPPMVLNPNNHNPHTHAHPHGLPPHALPHLVNVTANAPLSGDVSQQEMDARIQFMRSLPRMDNPIDVTTATLTTPGGTDITSGADSVGIVTGTIEGLPETLTPSSSALPTATPLQTLNLLSHLGQEETNYHIQVAVPGDQGGYPTVEPPNTKCEPTTIPLPQLQAPLYPENLCPQIYLQHNLQPSGPMVPVPPPYNFALSERPCLLFAKDFGVMEQSQQVYNESLDSIRDNLNFLQELLNNVGETTPEVAQQLQTLKQNVVDCFTEMTKNRIENTQVWLQSFGVERIVPSRIPNTKFDLGEVMEPLDYISISYTGARFLDLMRDIPEFHALVSTIPSVGESLDQLVLQQMHGVVPTYPQNTKKRSFMGDAEANKRAKLSPLYDQSVNVPLMFPGSPVMPQQLGTQNFINGNSAAPLPNPDLDYYNMYSSYNEAEEEEQETSTSSKKKKKKISEPKTQRTRIPKDTKAIWGFDADDIKKEYDMLLREGLCDKRGFKWSHIAKKIGNENFLKLGDCGPKLKAVLRRKYPELLEEKVKVPDDPKSEWGFTADEVKNKIFELCAQEGVTPGTPHKNISLSKIGAMLGHKDAKDGKHKPFSARSDRGQLVHALLKQKYPQLAQKFERSKK